MNTIKTLASYLWLPIVLCAFWWNSDHFFTSMFFPSLKNISMRTLDLWSSGELFQAIMPSLQVLFFGFLGALAIGLIFGIFLGLSPLREKISQPFLDFGRSIPAIAVLPILIIVLGPGALEKSVLIGFGAVWPILLNTVDGIRSVDPMLKDIARSFRLPGYLFISRVILPGALPQIAVGIRTGLSIAVILMVGSEMYGSTEGLGHFVVLAQQTFRVTDMWAGILILGILGYLINALYSLVDKRILKWRPISNEGL